MSLPMTWMIESKILIGPWRHWERCPRRLNTSLLIMLHKYRRVGKTTYTTTKEPGAKHWDEEINERGI